MAGIWWVASYPKSGNTWMRAFLYGMVSGKQVDINDLSTIGGHAARRDIIDDALGIDTSDMTPEREATMRGAAWRVVASEEKSDLFVKTHDKYDSLIIPADATLGAVYVIRNPLSVVASWAHHTHSDLESATNFICQDDRESTKLQSKVQMQLFQIFGNWSAHIESWLTAPFPIKVVRYEDMLADPMTTFGDVVRFAGVACGPEDVARVLEETKFDSLADQEQTSGFREIRHAEQQFFRRGSAESWKEELPRHLAERIVAAHGATMRRFGYPQTV